MNDSKLPESSTSVNTVQQPDKMSDLDKMSDKALVNFTIKRMVKYAMELRPLFSKIHERFVLRKLKGKPFLGYTDFDRFCLDVFRYTGRHVRRIINGENQPKKLQRKALPPPKPPQKRMGPLQESDVWTNHDWIHNTVEMIKKMLKPLEAEPTRYAKVAAAIAEEITGDAVPATGTEGV
jgi:hypothetical protein